MFSLIQMSEMACVKGFPEAAGLGVWARRHGPGLSCHLKVVAASGALARLGGTITPLQSQEYPSSSRNDSTNLVWSAYWYRRDLLAVG